MFPYFTGTEIEWESDTGFILSYEAADKAADKKKISGRKQRARQHFRVYES